MTKSNNANKTKGHKTDEVDYHIPYWTKEYFKPKAKDDDKDGEVVETVSVPVKINSKEKESKTNVSYLNIRAITHFDNNVESVLTTIQTVWDRLVRPKNLKAQVDIFKMFIQMLTLTCTTDQAIQTLNDCQKQARQLIWHIQVYDKSDPEKEKIFLADNNPLETYWKKTNHDIKHELLKDRKYADSGEYNK